MLNLIINFSEVNAKVQGQNRRAENLPAVTTRPCFKIFSLEVDRISASVSVSAPNVEKLTRSVDIRFHPKALVPHSVHFRFRRAAVCKFGGCRK